MSYHEIYGDRPYMARKKYADGVCLEVVDLRIRNGRPEFLSRWAEPCPNGSNKYLRGYRWRKLCGKGVTVPTLGRPAKDEHNTHLTIRDPFSGKMSRAYTKEFEWE